MFLAGWLAAALPMLLVAPGRIAAPLVASVLVLTGSRGGLLAAAAGIGWVAVRGAVPRSALIRIAAGSLVGLVVLAALRPASVAHLVTPALAGRADIWRTTGRMIRSAPLRGVGTGGFGAAYPCAQRAGAGPAWSPTLFAHNEYLHALAETGPVGLGLLVAWIVTLLRSRPPDALGRGAQGGVVALSVAALFAFPLHLPPTQLLWLLLPALWMTPEPIGRSVRPRGWRIAAGITVAAVIGWAPARLLLRNAELHAGIAASARDEWAPADARFRRAYGMGDTARDRIGMQWAISRFTAGELGEAGAILGSDEPRFPCTAEAVWYRAFIGVMRVAAGQRAAAGPAESEIALGLSLHPPEARAAGFWTLRGHLNASLGDRRGAALAYRAALELDPANRDARRNLDRLSGR